VKSIEFNIVPEWCPYTSKEISDTFEFDLDSATGIVKYRCVNCKHPKTENINTLRLRIRRKTFTSLCNKCRGEIQRKKPETFKLKRVPEWLKVPEKEYIEECLNSGVVKDIRYGKTVNRGLETLCVNCDTPIHSSISRIKRSIDEGTYTGLCIKCLSSIRNGVDADNPRIMRNGYVLIQKSLVPEEHYNLCNWSAPVMMHRYLMAVKLGRRLSRNEVVHHIDGNKQNNDIENLELWNKSHPSGQRVKDKLQWAKEFVKKYEKEII
jgi:hypothetical protein